MSGVEVISLVAAAGQFIEQTVKIVQLIKEVRGKWRNAPAETQQWIQEIETLKDIAGKVQQISALQTPEVAAILLRCEERSRCLHTLLSAISCEADANLGKKMWAAIIGVAQEGEIKAIFEDLEREKSSLIANIAAANL